jgi:hypothetical protein
MSIITDRIDANLAVNRDIARWSETRWHGCWCPEEGVGLYLHMGRCRLDLDLWWVQTAVYLPGGVVAVDCSWGRQTDPACVRTGVFELTQLTDGWHASFDGASELTTLDALTRGPRGAGHGAVPIAWAVRAQPATPVWDLYASRDAKREVFAGDTHLQQAYRTVGEVTVGGRSYRLDGVGYKDHSSGTREWAGYGAHNFLLAVMPEFSLHAIMLYGEDDEPRGPLGCVFCDGRQIPIERFELEKLNDPLGGSREYDVLVRLLGGQELPFHVDVLHQFPITITDEGENLNGIDWDAPLPTSVLQEAVARVTLPDGTTGHSFFERGVRRERLLSQPRSAA